jgi:hypothetical protein
MGSHDGAVFLSQLIYWTDRPKKRRDGYFYKSVSEWCEELDITEYQVERARAFLKKKGVLEMEKFRVRIRSSAFGLNLQRLMLQFTLMTPRLVVR